ncbi:class I SAM-dependent methyltransferase [Cohnella abietis]|uniref:Class I SAM-dependent methyltransferase n=1 Tax=Cohnella abietis TaxID=2507935 RepID=A0A3T1DCL5_9BACL|nr:class I SAM-dependent methyltransferase [Cohnella abietis]BBI35698.1 hypothetical protein KCTCHS21_50970 [Cohnella abietis]
MSSLYPIYIQFPIVPKPRFGGDQPPHSFLYDIINSNRLDYEVELRSFLQFEKEFASIGVHPDPDSPEQPSWNNSWFSGLDAVALYGYMANGNPARYYEIGSGFSTKFARRAVVDHGLQTAIVSIDPFPRDEIDDLCDKVIRQPLEDTDIRLFEELESGDILFVDSSHYVFQNSDANIVFLEILPRLKPGVRVHFHDIFLPEDYPASWSHRFYNEQYLLAAYLLAQGPSYKITFPSYFVSQDSGLKQIVKPIVDILERQGLPFSGGGSFWIVKS